jgi:hypothetical protein
MHQSSSPTPCLGAHCIHEALLMPHIAHCWQPCSSPEHGVLKDLTSVNG